MGNCGFNFLNFFLSLKNKMSDEIKNRTVYMLCRKDKSEDGTDIYIGSTSKTLEKRLSGHRSDAQSLKNGGSRVYKRMREIGLQNWKMVPLLTFSCDKKTIFEFEKQWIGLIGPDLNMVSPITDQKEYNAAYHKANKVTINQRHKVYRQNNRDAILKQSAEYRMVNRGMILEKGKEYREFNVQNKIHHCDVCNHSFGYKKDLKKHLGTLKHSNAYMNSVD